MGGGCLLLGGCLLQGVSAPGGVCSQGGVCFGGCLLQGGVCSWGGYCFWGVSACTEADTPLLWTESHMPVKTLPWPNFVVASKYMSRYRHFPLPVDLSAPGVSLRPPALVTLSRDTVKAHGTGDVVFKQRLPGSWCKVHHRTFGRCRMSHNDVAWRHLLAPLNTLPGLYPRSLTISHLAAWIP